jgi:hypothetical protein
MRPRRKLPSTSPHTSAFDLELLAEEHARNGFRCGVPGARTPGGHRHPGTQSAELSGPAGITCAPPYPLNSSSNGRRRCSRSFIIKYPLRFIPVAVADRIRRKSALYQSLDQARVCHGIHVPSRDMLFSNSRHRVIAEPIINFFKMHDLRVQDEAVASPIYQLSWERGPRNFYSVKVLAREREALWSSC